MEREWHLVATLIACFFIHFLMVWFLHLHTFSWVVKIKAICTTFMQKTSSHIGLLSLELFLCCNMLVHNVAWHSCQDLSVKGSSPSYILKCTLRQQSSNFSNLELPFWLNFLQNSWGLLFSSHITKPLIREGFPPTVFSKQWAFAKGRDNQAASAFSRLLGSSMGLSIGSQVLWHDFSHVPVRRSL